MLTKGRNGKSGGEVGSGGMVGSGAHVDGADKSKKRKKWWYGGKGRKVDLEGSLFHQSPLAFSLMGLCSRSSSSEFCSYSLSLSLCL